MDEIGSIERKWLIIPTVVLVVWLIFFFLPTIIVGKLWMQILLYISLFPVYGCLLYCGGKQKCPVCGAPLFAVAYRYVFEHKREIYCSECGQKIQIR